jgi:hypothetical protein
MVLLIHSFGDMPNKTKEYLSIRQFKIKQKIMKTKQLWLWAILVLLFSQCKKDVVETTADKVKKIWTVQSAKENGANVFTKGGTGNVKAYYSNFQLDLSNPPSVTLTEVDGLTFTGTYELVGDTKLILKNLTPTPFGTNGTIEFTITKIDGTQFEITRTTTNLKTGVCLPKIG